MPKLYEYFGLVVYFYAKEHEPVHVHGECQGRESRAEIIVRKGKVVRVVIRAIPGRVRSRVRNSATSRRWRNERLTTSCAVGWTSMSCTSTRSWKSSLGN